MYQNISKTKLFVTCDESQNLTSLCKLFEVIGPILGINFLKKKNDSNIRNLLITYENCEDAEKAKSTFNGMTLPNTIIPLKIKSMKDLYSKCYYEEYDEVIKSSTSNFEIEDQTDTFDSTENSVPFLQSNDSEPENCEQPLNSHTFLASYIKRENELIIEYEKSYNNKVIELSSENESDENNVHKQKVIPDTSEVIPLVKSINKEDIKLTDSKNDDKSIKKEKFDRIRKKQRKRRSETRKKERIELLLKNYLSKSCFPRRKFKNKPTAAKIKQDSKNVKKLLNYETINKVQDENNLTNIETKNETEVVSSTKKDDQLNSDFDNIKNSLPNIENSKESLSKKETNLTMELCDTENYSVNVEPDSSSSSNANFVEKINKKKRSYSDVSDQETSTQDLSCNENEKLPLLNTNLEISSSKILDLSPNRDSNNQQFTEIESKSNIPVPNALVALRDIYSEYDNNFNANDPTLDPTDILDSPEKSNILKTEEKILNHDAEILNNNNFMPNEKAQESFKSKKTRWDCKLKENDQNLEKITNNLLNNGIICTLYDTVYCDFQSLLVDFSQFGVLDFIKIFANKQKNKLYIFVKYVNLEDAESAINNCHRFYNMQWADVFKLPTGFQDVYDPNLIYHSQCQNLVNLKNFKLHEICCDFQRHLISRS